MPAPIFTLPENVILLPAIYDTLLPVPMLLLKLPEILKGVEGMVLADAAPPDEVRVKWPYVLADTTCAPAL